MRLGCHKLCNSMCQCRIGVHVENGKGVAAVLNATLAKNDGDKVHASRLEQRRIGSVGQVLDVYGGNITHDIMAVVNDSDTRQSLGVHQGQRVTQRAVRAARR